jgi:hypothetical protein
MRKIYLIVVMVFVVLFTACQPIEPTDSAEVEQLREQNQYLTKQLLEGQTLIRDLQIQVNTLSTQVAQMTPVPIQGFNFEGMAAAILPLLQAKDFTELASFVHPQYGLRFSPQLFIHTDTDLIFTRDQVANFTMDNNIYTWGTHAAKGDLLQLSVNDYWSEYVIPLLPAQDWVMLTEGQSSPSIAIDNFVDIYQHAQYVDFLKPGTEEFGNLDWQLLRLAFERSSDGAYYLVGIIHDNWVP